MKILKLLNKKYFSILLILLFGLNSNAEEQPVDIWNIDKKKLENNSSSSEIKNLDNNEIESNFESDIYKMQSKKKMILLS
tara:strand:+ start:173 stop:412 length:240 start_codon:yes stop_codon:yes gene_type:complete